MIRGGGALRPIDWPRLLGDLAFLLADEKPGTPHRDTAGPGALAEYLAVPRSTLRGWIEGSEPKHFDGECLLAVWCRLTGKSSVFAPQVAAGFRQR